MIYFFTCISYFLICLGTFHVLHRIQDHFNLHQFEVNLICFLLGSIAYGVLHLLVADKIDIISAFIIAITALWTYDKVQIKFLC